MTGAPSPADRSYYRAVVAACEACLRSAYDAAGAVLMGLPPTTPGFR
ncbi:MAG TPA: hypothetical protein VF821_20975 [Lentzea sp.]